MDTLPSGPHQPQAPRLLELVYQTALARLGQSGPAERFVHWSRRFILFHNKQHPRNLEMPALAQFLEHLAQTELDPLTALEQAREALTFLYEEVLHLARGEMPFPEPPKLLDRLRRALRFGCIRREPRTAMRKGRSGSFASTISVIPRRWGLRR